MYGLKAGDEIELMNVNQSRWDEFWKRNPDMKKKYFKGESKMYKFNIGDYVETVDGEVGYIAKIRNDVSARSKFYFVKLINSKKDYDIMFSDGTKPEYGFKRIGKYTFSPTKPEKKNKIEPLEPIENGFTASTHLFQKVIVNKLNEVIAYINKQEE